MYASNATSNARGVIILIRRNLGLVVPSFKKDLEGRWILINFRYEEQCFSLINMYTSNHDYPQFFAEIIETIEQSNPQNILWGGDFNLVMDIQMDKKKVLGRQKIMTKVGKL